MSDFFAKIKDINLSVTSKNISRATHKNWLGQIFCLPAQLTTALNTMKGRGVYLGFLFIVIAILVVSLLKQTIAIPEPQCHYNDLKQLQNNRASVTNLVMNPNNQSGDDTLKVKKVYYDPVEHNPITGQPDLNPNNAQFSSYSAHCPGGDCSSRLQTLLNNPDAAASMTKDEKKTTLTYNLAQLSNYYLPSFNIVNLSKNKYVDYINNIKSAVIMHTIYSLSMTFMVVFAVIWIVYAIGKLLWHFNMLGVDPLKKEYRWTWGYYIAAIIVIVVFFGLSIGYFKNNLDKEENPEEKTKNNVIFNNTFDYQKNFDRNIYGFFVTLLITCGLYWAQRKAAVSSSDTSSWRAFYIIVFGLYIASLLITAGFLLFFVFVLTWLCPQMSIIIMVVQRFLLSTIYKDEKEKDTVHSKSWNGWSLPLLPFLVLLIPMEQKQLNRHIAITNITF